MPQRRWKIISCLFLVVATLATYGDLRNHQFINYDDDVYVTNNIPVQDGLTLKGLSWAFTTFHAGNWHPITWLSHMLDCQLFGLNPRGHHLTNLFFHIANSLLLFLWLLYLTRTLGRSFLVAALFALHPLHVESVAWVAERKDVLSTFFWLTTMWAYVWYVERSSFTRYLLVLLSYALGLMAKPMLVTLPLVLLLMDWWPLGRFHRLLGPGQNQSATNQSLGTDQTFAGLILEKVPLLALAVISSIITILAQQQALVPLERIPFQFRLANAIFSYAGYLWKMSWPVHLAVLYPHPWTDLSWGEVAAAGSLMVVLSALVITVARRHPYLAVGWFWYLVTLLPVIGLVQVGPQGMADRYTYVPFIGLFIMVVWGSADLAARWRAPRFLLPMAAGTILAALMTCTWIQTGYWRDSISLYEHTLKVTRNNLSIHYNLGVALETQGKLDQAIAQYAEAIRLKPGFVDAHCNLGNALATQGKLDQAITQYAEAIRLKPGLAEAHGNLAVVLVKQGKLDQAIAQYAEAIRLKPGFAEAHYNLGNALAKQGKLDQAIAHYSEAIRLKPGLAEAYCNLGNALAKQGKIDEAIIICQDALKNNPDNTIIQKMLNNLKTIRPHN